jgi:hypothetical protein
MYIPKHKVQIIVKYQNNGGNSLISLNFAFSLLAACGDIYDDSFSVS